MQWTATGLTRPKPSMPPSRKHHNRIRDLVLQSAGRLFNRHGFNAVSIDDVMAEAGLTRGSFIAISRRRAIFTRNRLRASSTRIVKIQRAADPNANAPTRSCKII
jgi:hypothetical protein